MSKLDIPKLPGVVRVLNYLANSVVWAVLLIVAGFFKMFPAAYGMFGVDGTQPRIGIWYAMQFILWVSAAAWVVILTKRSLTPEEKDVVKEATEHERVRKSNIYRRGESSPFSREPNPD